MKKINNKHSINTPSSIKSITSYIKKLFGELFKTFSYASMGIFKILDFIITSLIKLFSYLFYGFAYLGKFTVKLGEFMYKYFLKYIYIELSILFRAFVRGLVVSLKIAFYEFPLFLTRIFSETFNKIITKTKKANDKFTFLIRQTPNAIKNYFVDKWNNLNIVKHYKNKREQELHEIFIDKFGKDAERTEKKLTYKYLARNKNGKLIKGYFPALSRLDVHSYLLDNGFIVYEIKTSWIINFLHGESSYLNRSMSNKNLVFWLAQLSTYIKSGIPLTDAVKILSEQDKRKKYKKVYDAIVYELTMGETFSNALAKQNNVFPALLVNMVKAAELIGDLEGTLDEMSRYYEEKEKTRKEMINAMIYPSIIMVIAIIVITFMVVYVVPQFKKVYDSMNAKMTGLTLFLLNASNFLKNYSTYLILGIIATIVALILLYKKVKAFRIIVQYFLMHLPVVGKLIIYNEMNLFAKTFAVLNKNNVLLTDSIDILSKITSNEFYKMIMYDTISNLLKGEKMSLSFKDNWAIPPLAYYMITTGEQTGELGVMREKVSEYYQREQRTLANVLKTFVEPILIVMLAAVVGLIMVSILVPMYSIGYEVIGK